MKLYRGTIQAKCMETALSVLTLFYLLRPTGSFSVQMFATFKIEEARKVGRAALPLPESPFGDPFATDDENSFDDPFGDAYKDKMAVDEKENLLIRKAMLASEKAEARRARQGAIRDIFESRESHQRREMVQPGCRVLLMLSSDLKSTTVDDSMEAAKVEAEDRQGLPKCLVDVLYEATVEEVMTKEKSHVLGIKVRVVGGKSGRVARILEWGEDSFTVGTEELGANDVKQIERNKGIRTQLSEANSAAKHALPYSTSRDTWIAKGPAAKAAAALAALDSVETGEDSKRKRFGEAGAKKMRRAVELQQEEAQNGSIPQNDHQRFASMSPPGPGSTSDRNSRKAPSKKQRAKKKRGGLGDHGQNF